MWQLDQCFLEDFWAQRVSLCESVEAVRCVAGVKLNTGYSTPTKFQSRNPVGQQKGDDHKCEIREKWKCKQSIITKKGKAR